MILSFYVKGRPEGAEDSDLSYMETAERWVQDKSVALPDLKFEDIMQWSKEFSADIWDKSIQAFRYLSGAPPPPAPSPPVTERQALEQPQKKDSSAWNFVGMFSGLRGQSRKGTGSTGEEHRTFLEGDVHADLVRVSPAIPSCLAVY
jgi:import inner membrane translocase subunit TIM21